MSLFTFSLDLCQKCQKFWRSHANVLIGSLPHNWVIYQNVCLTMFSEILRSQMLSHNRRKQTSIFSSGSSGRVREGPRNMKSMWLPLAAIFFMTYFHRTRGGAMATSAPPRSATDFILPWLTQRFQLSEHSLKKKSCTEVIDIYGDNGARIVGSALGRSFKRIHSHHSANLRLYFTTIAHVSKRKPTKFN